MILKIVLLSLCYNFLFALKEGPVVKLPEGWIRGNLINNYTAFQGIPYAAPPVKNLRFEEAQSVQPWSNVLNTREDPPACASYGNANGSQNESEDCLYLSVYSPGDPKNNLSVMVFFHGGAFTGGSIAKEVYGPEFLVLEGNVVVVTIQYRLGPFGFLSTGDEVLPGNLGLKDQVFALQWVKRNIHLFGGDPDKVTIFGESAGAASVGLHLISEKSKDKDNSADKVTIFGESAGAASVGLHLISEKSKGLFRAAICESGSALDQWTVDENPQEYAYKLSSFIDNNFSRTNTTLELKNILQNATVKQLNEAAATLYLLEHIQNWPVIEPKSYKNAFINKPYYDLVGKVSKVPLMIGDTSEESLFFYNTYELVEATAAVFDADPSSLIPKNFPVKANVSIATLGEKIKKMYLNDTDLFSNNLDKVVQFLSDQNFIRGNMEHALLHLNSSSVWFYEFSFEGRQISNFQKIPGAGAVPHAGELPFLFNVALFEADKTPANILTQKRMVRLWSNFAKYLNPTPTSDDLLEYVIWPKVTNTEFPVLNINTSLRVKNDYKNECFGKWREFFFENGVQPFVTF